MSRFLVLWYGIVDGRSGTGTASLPNEAQRSPMDPGWESWNEIWLREADRASVLVVKPQ